MTMHAAGLDNRRPGFVHHEDDCFIRQLERWPGGKVMTTTIQTTNVYADDGALLKRVTRLLVLTPKEQAEPERWSRRVTNNLHLLSLDNGKMLKGSGIEASLMLAPHTMSGYNVCPDSTAGCRESCVAFAGNGRFPATLGARIKRTRLFFENRGQFAVDLADDLRLLATLAAAKGEKLAVRLNTFSDLVWEKVKLFSDGSTAIDLCASWGITVYDYTKSARRALRLVDDDRYHLTLSRSEFTPNSHVRQWVRSGVNVAVPFHPQPPSEWLGERIIDGDETDQRYLDPRGVVVGLKAKGPGRSDRSGFVVRLED